MFPKIIKNQKDMNSYHKKRELDDNSSNKNKRNKHKFIDIYGKNTKSKKYSCLPYITKKKSNIYKVDKLNTKNATIEFEKSKPLIENTVKPNIQDNVKKPSLNTLLNQGRNNMLINLRNEKKEKQKEENRRSIVEYEQMFSKNNVKIGNDDKIFDIVEKMCIKYFMMKQNDESNDIKYKKVMQHYLNPNNIIIDIDLPDESDSDKFIISLRIDEYYDINVSIISDNIFFESLFYREVIETYRYKEAWQIIKNKYKECDWIKKFIYFLLNAPNIIPIISDCEILN